MIMNMKRNIQVLWVLMITLLSTSCLTNNLKDIDTYEGNDISSVSGVYHRYYGTEKIPGSDELQVFQSQLQVINDVAIDKEAGTVDITVTLPTNFPADQKALVKTSNLVVVLNISTAAVIEPLDGSAKLGIPADWSKSNRYRVTAANGASKDWTVTLKLQN